MRAVLQQAFDTKAFGVPFYRVVGWDEPTLAPELAELTRRRPIIIDAKLSAHDIGRVMALEQLGFRSVAMQIVLRHALDRALLSHHAITIADRLSLPAETLDRHVANFRFDRFGCDPLLWREGRDRIYRAWIVNSLSGRARVAYEDANFCSFSVKGAALTIDLLSVLDQRQGIGRSLLLAVLGEARESGRAEARVITECANEAAWRLYADVGFRVDSYLNCLHFVAA